MYKRLCRNSFCKLKIIDGGAVMSEEIKKESFPQKFSKGFTKFYKDVKGEIKKIVWPTRQQMINNTIIVVSSVIVVGLFVVGLDAFFAYLFDIIVK